MEPLTRGGTSRAPGRVNLIGDHTDYNHLPVLPMAIGPSVTVDFDVRTDDQIRLRAVSGPHIPAECQVRSAIPMAPLGDWRNYVHAAAAAVGRELQKHGTSARGIQGSVSGDVPLAAGLSSSSALVVAVGNALLAASGLDLPARYRMKMFAEAERYVGTEGGGMDQAASIGGREGHALLIRFAPLELTLVPVPGDWRFLVVATAQSAEKSGGVQDAYNRRSRLCRTALEKVSRRLEVELTYPLLLDDHGVAGALEQGRRALSGDELQFYAHTMTEAGRVLRAAQAMREGDAGVFGALMLDSHASLRDRFRVSTDALDRAVARAMTAGAIGARLTGAGFGGSVVALCLDASMDRVAEELGRESQTGGALEGARVFEVTASNGAAVVLRG